MTKLTMNDTPPAQNPAQTAKDGEHTYTDRNGRVVVIKRPRKVQEVAAMEQVGDVSRNAWAHYYAVLWVVSIDGERRDFSTKREMMAVIDKLDDGMDDLIDQVVDLSQEEQGAVSAKK